MTLPDMLYVLPVVASDGALNAAGFCAIFMASVASMFVCLLQMQTLQCPYLETVVDCVNYAE